MPTSATRYVDDTMRRSSHSRTAARQGLARGPRDSYRGDVHEPAEAWLTGASAPRPGDWLLFRETTWSYRQPISYEVTAPSGAVVATVAPVDGHTRSTSLVTVKGVPTVVLTIVRGGGTRVLGMTGEDLGWYRPAWTLTAWRLAVTVQGRQVATLNQSMSSSDAWITTDPEGRTVARIARAAGRRFAGASHSWLQMGDAAFGLPASLSVAAVPALDTFRRQRRRRRRW